MEFAEQDICQITETVWSSILGLDVQRSGNVISQKEQENFLTGYIHISGAWDGSVALHCTADLAREAATIMFRPEFTSFDDVRDALGELVNMIGGNVKALLSEHCDLSLPVVTVGFRHELENPDCRLLHQIAFESLEQPLLVTILERQTSALRSGRSG